MVKQLVDVITLCHLRTMIAFFDVVPLKRKSEKREVLLGSRLCRCDILIKSKA